MLCHLFEGKPAGFTTRIICGFLPAGRRIAGGHILYNFCEGVKAVWQKGFKP